MSVLIAKSLSERPPKVLGGLQSFPLWADYGQTAPYRLSSGPDRISSLNFAKVKKSAVRKSMPCSAKAFASAVIAAFVAATAAKAGFGSRAALPDIKTTEPLVC